MGTLTSRAAVIDLHSHILPGIDDGAPDLDASLAMARSAVAGGVETIVATPHISSAYPNDPATFAERVRAVQAAIDDAGIALHVETGAEVNHALFGDLTDDELRASTLGGAGYLLFEPSMAGPMPFIDRMIYDLQLKGFKILLAHPERIAAFQRDLDTLKALVDRGCLCSVTAGSASGQWGGPVKRFTQELFERGLVHNIASDAHDADFRSPGLQPFVDKALESMPELEDHIEWLTVTVPEAILAGEVPRGEPPRIEPKRGLLGRLRRR